MVNKIISNNLLDCKVHLEQMLYDLRVHYDEFYNCQWIMDFEKVLLLPHNVQQLTLLNVQKLPRALPNIPGS